MMENEGIFCGYPYVIARPTWRFVRRTWRERLLSWPWHPFVAERYEVVPAKCAPDQCITIPDPKGYNGVGLLIMGEAFYEKMRADPRFKPEAWG